jgi:hypothetical protein
MATATAFLLLIMGSTSPQSPTITTAAALTLPNLIGAISHQQRQHQRQQRSRSNRSSRSNNKSPPSSNQMHSITLTIDDTDPSGLWNVMSPSRGNNNNSAVSSQSSSLQQRRRIGFRFFRSDSADNSQSKEGTSVDTIPLPSSKTSSSSSLLVNSYSSASTNTAAAAAAAAVVAGTKQRQHGARSILHGFKRNLMSINMAISISTGGTTANGGATTTTGGGGGGGGMSFGGVVNRHLKNRRLMVVDHRLLKEQHQQKRQREERQLDSSLVVFETVNYSTKTTTTMASTNTAAAARSDHEKDDVGLITADLMEDITAASNDVGLNVNKAMRVIASAPPRGGDLSTATTSADVGLSTATVAADTTSSTTSRSSQQEATFIIETPLFPIILPKAWEAPFMGTSSYSKSTTASASGSSSTTAPSSSSSYISSMEITVAPPEDITTSSSSGGGTVKPTSHQLQQVTLPLIPKSQWTSFTGQEFFYPEPYNGLVDTGVCMSSNTLSSEYVTWSGDKKTEKFIKDYMTAAANYDDDDDGEKKKKKSWYDVLDSSQEVLVWSGKFISSSSSNNEEYYGSELPIIKTTSIIHKSPKYLAELLMDSTKVKAYNKMSLGRDDVHVFQSGVDTTKEDGKLGVDGECKIVRNLTRPPMVNSNLEFVSEYYSLSLCFEVYVFVCTN